MCAAILYRLDFVLPEESFALLAPLMSIKEEFLLKEIALIMKKCMTTSEQFNQLIALPGEYTNGILMMIEEDQCVTGNYLTYLAHVMMEDPRCDIKVMAAKILNRSLVYIYEPEGDPHLEFVDPLIRLFSLDLTEETIPVLANLSQSVSLYLDPQTAFQLFFQHFVTLSEYVPLEPNSETLDLAGTLAMNIGDLIFNNEIEFDEYDLIENTINHCLIHPNNFLNWSENFELYFTETHTNEDLDDGDIDSIRPLCMNILYSMDLLIVIDTLKEFIEIDELHAEAALYVLHTLLNKKTDIPFDIPIVSDSNPFIYGRYIICVCQYDLDIDPEIIKECIESDSNILVLLTADAILKTDKHNQLIPEIVYILFSYVDLFTTDIKADFLNYIVNLINKAPELIVVHIQDFFPIIYYHLQINLQFFNSRISSALISAIEEIGRFIDVAPSIHQSCFPLINACFESQDTCDIGIDFASSLLLSYDQPILIAETQELFNYFYQSISNFAISDMVYRNLMSLVFYFIRNGEGERMLVWYLNQLNSIIDIESKCFHYLASIIVHLFEICDKESKITIFKLIYQRIRKSDSVSFNQNACITVASLVLINHVDTLELLQAAEIDINILIELMNDQLKSHLLCWIDRLIIVLSFFQIPQLEIDIFGDGVKSPLIEVALRAFISMYEKLDKARKYKDTTLSQAEEKKKKNESSAFFNADPFYLSHIAHQISLINFFSDIFPPLSTIIPSEYQEKLSKIEQSLQKF